LGRGGLPYNGKKAFKPIPRHKKEREKEETQRKAKEKKIKQKYEAQSFMV